MSWTGNMTTNVINNTGAKITNVRVSHTLNNQTQSATAEGLEPGASMPLDIKVGSGGNDYWSLAFNIGTEGLYHDKKRCNIDKEDNASGKPVTLTLGNAAEGFSTTPPKTSGNRGVAYEIRG